LFTAALAETGASAFDEFLDFAVRFSDLSIYNAMLVRIQRPGAGAVATKLKWARIGREITPGAIPIVILRPFGPVSLVFDDADTYGNPLPAEKSNPLFATGDLPYESYEQTSTAAAKYGVTVSETDQYGALLAGTASGMDIMPNSVKSIDQKTKKDKRTFTVKLNAKHDLATRYATLAHELGHIYCGHVGEDSLGRWPNRSHIDKQVMELEAEAVAWLVCQRNGVLTRSRDYLASLIHQSDLSMVSMYSVFEAANRVESRTLPSK
jgi:hypothetical protein